MFSHVSVHPSIHPSVCPQGGGGGYPGHVQPGGYPSQVQLGSTPVGGYSTSGTPCQTWGVPLPGGTPPWVTLSQTWLGGTPPRVAPHQIWLGDTPAQGESLPGGTPAGGTPPQVPPSDLARGVPHLEYPSPPIRPGWGVPLLGGTPLQETDGVLDTPRSVCLLRSHRRTYFFFFFFAQIRFRFFLSKF